MTLEQKMPSKKHLANRVEPSRKTGDGPVVSQRQNDRMGVRFSKIAAWL